MTWFSRSPTPTAPCRRIGGSAATTLSRSRGRILRAPTPSIFSVSRVPLARAEVRAWLWRRPCRAPAAPPFPRGALIYPLRLAPTWRTWTIQAMIPKGAPGNVLTISKSLPTFSVPTRRTLNRICRMLRLSRSFPLTTRRGLWIRRKRILSRSRRNPPRRKTPRRETPPPTFSHSFPRISALSRRKQSPLP